MHEAADAAQYAEWGVSYLKDDACSVCRDSDRKGSPADYSAMAAAIKASSNPEMLLMVEGQPELPAAASGLFGQYRRVGHDINPTWLSMLSLVDLSSGLWTYVRPGPENPFFNDLEMMEIGNGDFIPEDSPEAARRTRTHFSLWCLLKSPLLLSTRLDHLGNSSLAMLLDQELIAISQDPLGKQARRVKSTPNLLGTMREPSRDVVAVAALCDSSRTSQKWFLSDGNLWTRDGHQLEWCLGMVFSGIWSVVPYNTSSNECVGNAGEGAPPMHWRAEQSEDDGPIAFLWPTRPQGFGWSIDVGGSGPVPHSRWLLSVHGGNWTGNLTAATIGIGSAFSPSADSVIDDDGIGGVHARNASDFCLDVVTSGNVEVWQAELNHGRHVVAVVNRSPADAVENISWKSLGFSQGEYAARDVWGKTNLGLIEEQFECQVSARDTLLLVLTPNQPQVLLKDFDA